MNSEVLQQSEFCKKVMSLVNEMKPTVAEFAALQNQFEFEVSFLACYQTIHDEAADIDARFFALTSIMGPGRENELAELPYQEFLETVYWKIIAAYVKHKNPSCSMCPSTNKLRAHHKHYRNRGREYRFLDDLTVVCDDCHSKHHEKE